MSALIDGLKWLRELVKPNWLWWPLAAIITISVSGFGIWSSFPTPTKEKIAGWIESRFTTVRGVYVEPFTTSKGADQDLEFLRSKTERNIAKFLWSNKIRVGSGMEHDDAPPLAYMNRISGSVEETKDGYVTIHVDLKDKNDTLLASGELASTAKDLKLNYESIPIALMYSAGIDVRQLPTSSQVSAPSPEDRRRPTSTPIAYLHLAEAQRLMGMNKDKSDKALDELKEATTLDSSFATAWWSEGEIYRYLGQAEAADAAYKKADAISKEYPKPPIVTVDSDPWPYLITNPALNHWDAAGNGASTLAVEIPTVDLSLRGWRFDKDKFAAETRWAETQKGKTARDFLADDNSLVLAVDGGFFDMDNNDLLKPSGLLIVNGKSLFPLSDSGSGLLLVSAGETMIKSSKDRSALPLISNASFAVQSGPILVDRGSNGINSDDGQRQRRAAVCLTHSQVTIIAVDGRGISLFELGKLLSMGINQGGFGCDYAINLDGGPSVQVAFKNGQHTSDIGGLWNISDAVVLRSLDPKSPE